jgi:hypothetical protein
MHLTATPEWQTLTLKLNYISIATLIYANITATSRILRNKIAKNLKIFMKIQWVKKLSQCLAVLERLTCRKTSKLHNNLKIIYEILSHLGFQTSPISYDLG